MESAVKSVVCSNDGTIQVDEHHLIVATFPESKKRKIGQMVSFNMLSGQGKSFWITVTCFLSVFTFLAYYPSKPSLIC
jgi:hypothetical protein